MADHPHTIDRWDDATGENPIEQIAAGDLSGGGEPLAKGQDHAAQPRPVYLNELIKMKGPAQGRAKACDECQR